MKRTLCILLTLALAMPAFLYASAEGAVFTTPYYTLTLPEDWEIDMSDTGSEDGYEYLGCFYAPDDRGLAVYAFLEYFEDMKDFSLWNAGVDEIREYAEMAMEDLADDDPVFLGTVMAGSIPFVLIRGTDGDGNYLYADTMTNGYVIEFEAYVLDWDDNVYPVTDRHIEQFRDILATLVPVT
ncbi:MAG: hypothetical protein IKI84_00065 [Clostridia bacterium]|nr:hypothetical protein [Clostridia bacterium]